MKPEQIPIQVQERADDEIDLGVLIDIILEGKWLVLFITTLGAALGVAYAMLATPIYKADALIQIEDKRSSLAAVFGEMGGALGEPSQTQGEVELIQSRLVLGRTVEALQLDLKVEPVTLPVIGPGLARLRDRRAGIRPPAWRPASAYFDGQYLRIGRFEVPRYQLNRSFRIRARAQSGYELLDPQGSVIGRGLAGEALELPDAGIRLLVTELEARPGQEFLVTRMDPLRATNSLRADFFVTAKSKGYRDSGIVALALEATSGLKAQQILNSIANNYLRQNVERKGAEAEKTLEYLRSQLPQLRGRLDEAEAQLNIFRTGQGSADLMQETELLLQQSAKLEGLRLELAQQREQLTQRFKPGHPTVQALDAQLGDLETNREKLEKKIRALPETQQQLLRLTRDVQVNTELYTSLLNSAQQLEVAKAGTIGTVRIIDNAEQPLAPIKPRQPLVVLLGVMLGGAFGIMAVFLRRMLLGTVDDPQFIEQQMGLPIYANIPRSKAQVGISGMLKKHAKGIHTLTNLGEADLAQEAFKSLRTSLHFALHEAPNNLLLITGPRPEVGKTFVCSNLADVFAQVGKSVVVVDCDMRRGTLHNYFGEKRKPGLADYLIDRAQLSDIIKSQREGKLSYIVSGTIPPNPSELLSSAKFEELLTTLSERYDLVILDSPPNLAVTDPSILAQRAGTTVLVLAANEHPSREIAESIKRLKLVGANLKGGVLNKVNQVSRRYGYGRYNYYYAYGSSKKS